MLRIACGSLNINDNIKRAKGEKDYYIVVLTEKTRWP